MKAWVITKYSSSETPQFQEIEEPILGKKEVLIEVHSAQKIGWIR